VLGWGPAEFRQATIRDLFDAIEGWREAHGTGGKPVSHMTRQRVDELKALYG
jgi:hypothetical protein